MKMTESFVARWISIGAAAVTLLVTASINMDPVNVSKLLLTAGLGFGMWVVVIVFNIKSIWSENKPLFLATLIYLLLGVVTLFTSNAPLTQNFYGVNGRNTGFLAYLALTGIMLASSQLRNKKSFTNILYALFIAGALNVLYCLLEISGHDFVGWNNIYNTILGTFGNPDFISAFLGIFISGSVAYIFKPGLSWAFRGTGVIFALVALYEVKKSHAIQGLAVTAIGLSIIGFYLVRSYFKKNIITWSYLLASIAVGAFAVAGALQHGPLTKYIYKTSVSLRGQYWKAGITMAKDHPFTGVGFDTYGDWYRRARSARAMILPGPTVITNAAHNVFIDVLASGGFIFFAAYLAIFVIALVAIVRVTLRSRVYDAIFVALAVAWICYNVQAFISINQIGLAIWGWLLSGSVIAFEHATRVATLVEDQPKKVAKKKPSSSDTQPGVVLAGVGGFVIGLIIALPPFVGDSTWRNAMRSGNAQQVEAAALRFPLDSYRLANGSFVFENSKLYAQAISLARKGVEYNPDYFDAWKVLATVSQATPAEKAQASAMMHKLDPRNTLLK